MKKTTFKRSAFSLLLTGGVLLAQAQWTKAYLPSQFWPTNDVKSFNGSLYVAANSGVYRSNDDGASWIDLSQGYAASSSSSFLELFFVSGNIYCRTSTQGVLRSTTGETTWAHDTAGIGAKDVKAMYYDATSGKLFIGLTWPLYGFWTKLPSDPSWTKITSTAFASNVQPVQITRKGTKLFMIDVSSKIFESADDGLTWTQKASVNLPGTGAADAASKLISIGNDLYLGHNGVWKSSDDGDNWVKMDVGFALSFGVFVDTRSIYYDGATLYAGVWEQGNTYSSSDLGVTWNPMGTSPAFIKSMVKHNGTLYGAGHGSDSLLIYGGVSGISEAGLESSVKLFPNPANDVLTISEAPEGSAVSIADISGKVVIGTTAFNERTIISIAGLSSGLYSIRIASGGAIVYKKLVVSR